MFNGQITQQTRPLLAEDHSFVTVHFNITFKVKAGIAGVLHVLNIKRL